MRFTVRLLGAEVLHVDTDRDSEHVRTDVGDATSTPMSAPETTLWLGNEREDR